MRQGEERKVYEEMLYDYENHYDNLIINHCIHFMQLSISHFGEKVYVGNGEHYKLIQEIFTLIGSLTARAPSLIRRFPRRSTE
jgi:hypothetical protein